MKKPTLKHFLLLTVLLFPLVMSAELSDGIQESLSRGLLFLASLVMVLIQVALTVYHKPGQTEKTILMFLLSAGIIILSVKIGTIYTADYYYNLPAATESVRAAEAGEYDHASVAGEEFVPDSAELQREILEEQLYVKKIQNDYYIRKGYCYVISILSLVLCGRALWRDLKV